MSEEKREQQRRRMADPAARERITAGLRAYHARRREEKSREAKEKPPTREELYAWLRELKDDAAAGGRPNYTAILKAIELLGKTQGAFVDVQKVENAYAAKTPEELLTDIRMLLVNVDFFRERIREMLEDYDAAKGGPPSGGRAFGGGHPSSTGPVSPPLPPGSLSLRRIQ